MLIHETELIAIDFETTGTVPGYPDIPWQIGLLPIRLGRPDPTGAVDQWLRVEADRPFNPLAPGSWRLVRKELAAAPALPHLLPVLRDRLLGVPLVAHHAATERKVLRHAWPLQRPGPWIDTLTLSRQAFPGLRNHDLSSVVAHAGLVDEVAALAPGRFPHDALYDAAACACLFCFFIHQPEWSSLHVEDLMRIAPRKHPRP
jgi:DNA polymerase III epsilon subunit-like protein